MSCLYAYICVIHVLSVCLHLCNTCILSVCLHLCNTRILSVCLHLCNTHVLSVCLHLCNTCILSVCLHLCNTQILSVSICLHNAQFLSKGIISAELILESTKWTWRKNSIVERRSTRKSCHSFLKVAAACWYVGDVHSTPLYQEPAATYWAQLYPLYIFYTEEFSTVFLQSRDQHVKQLFCIITICPDDGPTGPKTCMS